MKLQTSCRQVGKLIFCVGKLTYLKWSGSFLLETILQSNETWFQEVFLVFYPITLGYSQCIRFNHSFPLEVYTLQIFVDDSPALPCRQMH